MRNLLSRFSWYGIPIIVFGDETWSKEVATSLKYVRRLGWVPTQILPLDDIEQMKLSDSRDEMAILAPDTHTSIEKYARLLYQRFRRVLLIRKTDNFGSLWVEPRDLDGYLGLEFHYHLLARRNKWLKRIIDFLGSAFLILIFSPILILLSLLIAISSPGPVFYRQERLGKDFHPFHVLKFRSMVLGAEEKLQELLEKNLIAKTEYDKFHKLENDPRVTKIGTFLRKYSLDELPQLWNVLKGEMSLSGPRAYMSSELDNMGSYASTILRVTPGITGWWQVSGRNNTSFQKRLEMDEYYISNWSLWMDTYIILKTVLVVISGTGT